MNSRKCEILTNSWPPRINGTDKFFGLRDFGLFMRNNCNSTEQEYFCAETNATLEEKWDYLYLGYQRILNDICGTELLGVYPRDKGRFLDAPIGTVQKYNILLLNFKFEREKAVSFCKSVLIEVDLQNTAELQTPLLSQYSDSRCSRNLQIGLSFLGALGFIHFLLSIAILGVLIKKKSIDRNLNFTKISINILHLLQSAALVPLLLYFTIALSNDRTLSNSTLLANDSSLSFREKAFNSWYSIGNILAFLSIFVIISKLWIYSFLSLDRILIIKNPLSARSKTRTLRIRACLGFSYLMGAAVAIFVSFFYLTFC